MTGSSVLSRLTGLGTLRFGRSRSRGRARSSAQSQRSNRRRRWWQRRVASSRRRHATGRGALTERASDGSHAPSQGRSVRSVCDREKFPAPGDLPVSAAAAESYGLATPDVRRRACAIESSPGVLVEFDPGERHAVRAVSDTRLLLLLTPWPAAGHPGAMSSRTSTTPWRTLPSIQVGLKDLASDPNLRMSPSVAAGRPLGGGTLAISSAAQPPVAR
jgi:hypothetical protein